MSLSQSKLYINNSNFLLKKRHLDLNKYISNKIQKKSYLELNLQLYLKFNFIKNLNNYDYVLYLVKNGRPLKLIPNKFKNNYNIILAAVKNGESLEFLLDEFKDNFDIVLNAVKIKGIELQYASYRLKNNKYIVLTAIQHCYMGHAFKYASELLKNNKEVVFAAIKKWHYMLTYASDFLKDDKEIGLFIVKNNRFGLSYLSEKLKNDYDIVLAAVSNSECALYYASNRFKNNETIVLTALKYIINNHKNISLIYNLLKITNMHHNMNIMSYIIINSNKYYIQKYIKDDNNKILSLINNLEHNYNNFIINISINDIYLIFNNIKYILQISNFNELLKELLYNYFLKKLS
jgi:hypothetical protein